MQIRQIVLGSFDTNCYIISGLRPGNCIIIDPADDAGHVLDLLEQIKAVPEAILLTHGHYDHFLAVPDLQKQFRGLPVYCHPLDCPKETVEYDMGQVFPTVTAFDNRKPLKEQEHLTLAGLDILVLHTPGHTPGSVTFVIEDALFTGDTLFRRSIGRTDFAGGSDKKMQDSLKRLAGMTGNYKVFPGHEGTTTLKEELRFNPYLKSAANYRSKS